MHHNDHKVLKTLTMKLHWLPSHLVCTLIVKVLYCIQVFI